MNADLMVTVSGGGLRFVYDDQLVDLMGAGEAHVRRASHVEPNPDGSWSADLSPVDGPVLGPYRLRAEALAAEVDWLRVHVL